MYIVTLTEPATIGLRKSTGGRAHLFAPNTPYIVPDHVLRKLREDMAPILYKVSDLSPRLRNFTAGRAGQGSVIFYNGSGGYGDQIMSWPLPGILKERGYRVHVVTEPGNESLWWGVPGVETVATLPIELRTLDLFDHHAIFPAVVNFDEHPGQRHPLDAMLYKIGIDPVSVTPESKVSRIEFTDTEKARAASFVAGSSVAMYQLSASIRLRSLPPAAAATGLAECATVFPSFRWMACYDDYTDTAYVDEAAKLGLPNVQTIKFPTARDFMAVTSLSKLAVSPDSFLIHAAGVCRVPCIGLWGATDPAKRAAYYPEHHAVYAKEVCTHAPCFHAGGETPLYCPASGGCGVMSANLAVLRRHLKQLADQFRDRD